jgi:RNA polymerase sigma-70 factor (ECF subfamily)
VDEKLRPGPIEASGDFEDAFREHFAPVYRFIARRVGTGLAEDLAAEAFATAYRRRASYDPGRGSLRSWLFGIATNVVREHWRTSSNCWNWTQRWRLSALGLSTTTQTLA